MNQSLHATYLLGCSTQRLICDVDKLWFHGSDCQPNEFWPSNAREIGGLAQLLGRVDNLTSFGDSVTELDSLLRIALTRTLERWRLDRPDLAKEEAELLGEQWWRTSSILLDETWRVFCARMDDFELGLPHGESMLFALGRMIAAANFICPDGRSMSRFVEPFPLVRLREICIEAGHKSPPLFAALRPLLEDDGQAQHVIQGGSLIVVTYNERIQRLVQDVHRDILRCLESIDEIDALEVPTLSSAVDLPAITSRRDDIFPSEILDRSEPTQAAYEQELSECNFADTSAADGMAADVASVGLNGPAVINPNRTESEVERPIQFDALGLMLWPKRRVLERSGKVASKVDVRPLHANLLKILMKAGEELASVESLHHAWDADCTPTKSNFDSEIAKLRRPLKKLGLTVFRKKREGCRLVADDTANSTQVDENTE